MSYKLLKYKLLLERATRAGPDNKSTTDLCKSEDELHRPGTDTHTYRRFTDSKNNIVM